MSDDIGRFIFTVVVVLARGAPLRHLLFRFEDDRRTGIPPHLAMIKGARGGMTAVMRSNGDALGVAPGISGQVRACVHKS